ncbi:hypothetical protein [Streptomyces sp. NPDC052701]|uniref:hypothetical protein n=1 Tax=Streptomyces sp. NPDC052701 TaxID=3155533 RepID=UPI003435296C
MSGGPRYWNEETQRWEDGTGGTAPATPPPPPRPGSPPPVPQGRGGGQPDGAAWSAPEVPYDDSWTVADRAAPGPPAARGHSRRLVWSVLGGAVAAGVAAALVLTLLVGDGDGADGPGGGRDDGAVPASTSPTAGPSSPGTPGTGPTTDDPGTPSADDPATPSDPAAGLPAGYELHEDAEGFTLARPPGWTRRAVPSQYGMDVVHYRSADGERRLQVFEVEEASPEASFDLFLSDATPKAAGFRKLSLRQLDDGGVTGARLEYLAASIKGEPDVGTWHVVDDRFRAADGRVYAIAAYGPDADGREDERELLDTARRHFCPPHTTCAADPALD